MPGRPVPDEPHGPLGSYAQARTAERVVAFGALRGVLLARGVRVGPYVTSMIMLGSASERAYPSQRRSCLRRPTLSDRS